MTTELYPTRLQAVLLFEGQFDALDALIRDFTRITELKYGLIFASAGSAARTGSVTSSVSSTRGEDTVRLASASGHLTVSFSHIAAPPPIEPFEGALASAITGILNPRMRERLAAARTHLLLEVEQESGEPDAPAGPATEAFTERLETLALMVRIATDHAEPSCIHWAQSDQLLDPQTFESFVTAGLPGPLHIHPHLFGEQAASGQSALIGLRTFGAAHWLGREVVMPPSALAWEAGFESVLSFLHLATMEGGYIIPDGDTFGTEDGSESYRVIHREAGLNESGEAIDPAYEIIALRHDGCTFVSPDYVASAQIVRSRAAAPEALTLAPQQAQEVHAEVTNAIADTRRKLEGIEGRLELHVPVDPEDLSEGARQSLGREQAAEAPSQETAETAPMREQPLEIMTPTPSQPGLPSVSGRSLRARVFGKSES
ncbi:MAG: hypothetical protein AAFR88_12855 [Pseudomonadota bacterium]